uniref:Adaptor protein-2 complex subunit mu-1 n=1 Tax=Collodictyon triciliatum TaxID=190325 RepID=H8ZWP4_9EUKA
MISAIFFLSAKTDRGELLISRVYRDDLGRGVVDNFRQHILNQKSENNPIVHVTVSQTSYLYVRHQDLYVVAVTRQNASASLVFEFLFKMLSIFKAYFGGVFDEDAVRNNFVLIYELLDEILDYGYPQNTEIATLKLYIMQEGVLSEKSALDQSQITMQATGAVGWRRPDIKYRKNEIFIDVIESVNLLLSTKGTVLRSDVSGQVMIKSFLSGMPECKFGLNDKVMMEQERASNVKRRQGSAVEIDDCTFHQCVRLGKFDSDRTISFIPPDGEFELMKYRTTQTVNLPFKVIPLIKELGRTRVEVKVTVKSQFGPQLYANNVVVKIPTPKNTAICRISTPVGKAKYSPETSCIIWKIKKFAGDSEVTLGADVELVATTLDRKPWSRPPSPWSSK